MLHSFIQSSVQIPVYVVVYVVVFACLFFCLDDDVTEHQETVTFMVIVKVRLQKELTKNLH